MLGYVPPTCHPSSHLTSDRGGQGRRGLESTAGLLTGPFLPEGVAGIQMALGIAIATVPFRSCHGLQEQGVSNAEEGETAGGKSTPSRGGGCDNKQNLIKAGIYEPEVFCGALTFTRPRAGLGTSPGSLQLQIHTSPASPCQCSQNIIPQVKFSS